MFMVIIGLDVTYLSFASGPSATATWILDAASVEIRGVHRILTVENELEKNVKKPVAATAPAKKEEKEEGRSCLWLATGTRHRPIRLNVGRFDEAHSDGEYGSIELRVRVTSGCFHVT
jgi:hypothetical protein